MKPSSGRTCELMDQANQEGMFSQMACRVEIRRDKLVNGMTKWVGSVIVFM